MLDHLQSLEKRCKICSRVFLVRFPSLYTYKIEIGNRVNWYCCYTCFRKDKNLRKKEKRRNP